MIEIHEDDALAIKRHLRVKSIPDDVAVEYSHRMQWAGEDGHVGSMGMWPIIDMLKYLNYKPPKKQLSRIQVDWRRAPAGAQIVVSDTPDMKGFTGWFEAYQPGGILTVRSPHRPGPIDVFAKYVRPATEDDDLTALADGMPTGVYDEEAEDDEFVEYANDEPEQDRKQPKAARRDPEEDDEDEDDDYESDWTPAHIGRPVLVEDGDAELTGTIVGVTEDGKTVTVTGEINGEEFTEDYPGNIVFADDPNPVMEAAVAQMAAEEAKAAKKKAKSPAI